MSGKKISLTDSRISQVLAVAYMVFTVLVALPGCSENSPSNLRVEKFGAIMFTVDEKCMENIGAPGLHSGIMDIRYTNTYTAFPLLKNDLKDSTTAASSIGNAMVQQLKNMNSMHLVGVNLKYTINTSDDEGVELQQDVFGIIPSPFFKHLVGYINVEGELMLPVDIVPEQIGRLIAGSTAVFDVPNTTVEILVHMTFEAKLLDGTVVNSDESIMPITICNGCLLDAPLATDCCALGGDYDFPCFPGQNEFFDCRACCEQYGPDAIDARTGAPMCSDLPPAE